MAMYESTAQDFAQTLWKSEYDRAVQLFMMKARTTAERIRKASGGTAAQKFLQEALAAAEAVGTAAGDRAAATYLQISRAPVDELELKREMKIPSNTEAMLAAMGDGEWKTTALMEVLHWGHGRTSQTIQYLIRKGKIAKSGKGQKVTYRKTEVA